MAENRTAIKTYQVVLSGEVEGGCLCWDCHGELLVVGAMRAQVAGLYIQVVACNSE